VVRSKPTAWLTRGIRRVGHAGPTAARRMWANPALFAGHLINTGLSARIYLISIILIIKKRSSAAWQNA